ncbi:MAG TPA: aminopeptidase, partial [Thermoplasmata archaeon]|nr:aminopeptidase [Thermoplasmata archaeon]
MSEYEALAKSVIKRTLQVKPKENVIVECWNHGLPIATEFVYQLRAHGARSMLLLEDEETFWRGVATLPKSKLGQVGSHEWKAMGEADAYIFITGPADITKIRELGRDKYNAATEYNDEWYRRAKRNRLRGARIGLGYATEPRARAYGFDLAAWRAMLLEASAVDPREIVRRGRKLASILSKPGRVEITAPNGTRFSCDLVARKAGIEDGMITKEDLDRGDNMANIPAGEVYVVPDEKSGEGTIVFDRPVAYLGRWIKGITLAF